MSGLAESAPPEKPKERKTHTAEATGVRLNITISKKKQSERPELVEKYDVENYDLIQGQTFDDKLRALIPRGTPEYLDHGEKYVERITRALYHFKQCALIGPSGTGKTHIVYLVAETLGSTNLGNQLWSPDLSVRLVRKIRGSWQGELD